jgi:hypothetical protein
MEKQTNSCFAIPILAMNGSVFFIKFNTKDEKEAMTLANCISSRAPYLLTILTDNDES